MSAEQRIKKLKESGLTIRKSRRGSFYIVYIKTSEGDKSYYYWPKSDSWRSSTFNAAGTMDGIDRLISLGKREA